MLSDKIKEYLNEYISQEVYVQVAIAKGKNKISTNAAINKYFESNHFQGLAEGKPYNTFLDDLKDKCLGKLVTKPMLKLMKRGSVIVDVAIDQGGCVETSKPTTHGDPTFIIDDVVHYCVANMPGGVPRTSTIALNTATLPHLIKIANKGYAKH